MMDGTHANPNMYFVCEYKSPDFGFVRKNCTVEQRCCSTGCCSEPTVTITDDSKDSKYPWYLWVILADVVVALIIIAYFWWRKMNSRQTIANHGRSHQAYRRPSYNNHQRYNNSASPTTHGAQKTVKTHMLLAFKDTNVMKPVNLL